MSTDTTLPDPNTLWTKDTDMEEVTGEVEVEAPEDEVETILAIHRNLVSFWAKHSSSFIKTWNQMTPETKRNFVRTTLMEIPESPTDPFFIVNGQKMYNHDQIKLVPEIFIKNLVAKTNLIDLMKDFSGNSIATLAKKALEFVRKQLKTKGILRVPFPSKRGIYYNIGPKQYKFGQTFQMGNDAKSFLSYESLRTMGDMANDVEYHFVVQKLWHTIFPIAQLADEFRAEVLGHEDLKVSSPAVGCSNCKKVKCDDGKPLKFCQRCNIAMYCSKECQKEDWPKHKVLCKEVTGGSSAKKSGK